MVAAPGHLRVTSGFSDTIAEFDVKPEDYELEEVVLGGQHYGWERTWRSKPLHVPEGVELVAHFGCSRPQPILARTNVR